MKTLAFLALALAGIAIVGVVAGTEVVATTTVEEFHIYVAVVLQDDPVTIVAYELQRYPNSNKVKGLVIRRDVPKELMDALLLLWRNKQKFSLTGKNPWTDETEATNGEWGTYYKAGFDRTYWIEIGLKQKYVANSGQFFPVSIIDQYYYEDNYHGKLVFRVPIFCIWFDDKSVITKANEVNAEEVIAPVEGVVDYWLAPAKSFPVIKPVNVNFTKQGMTWGSIKATR